MQNKPAILDADKIIRLSQQCVKCGLCLPHCPTYKLNNLEGQSPRGRIALWQNLANNNLKLTNKTAEYLEQCLSCGSCENHCPAGVEFLKLQDLGKKFLLNKAPIDKVKKRNFLHQLITRAFIKCISSPFLTKLLHYILFVYQRCHLHYFTKLVLIPLPKTRHHINTIYQKLPKLNWRYPKNHKDYSEIKHSLPSENVIIFAGCINKLTANNTIDAALSLLKKLHINPYLLNNLHCCGALYTHHGEFDKAKNLVNNNIKIIKDLLQKKNISHVLTIDTGCHPEILKQLEENDINLKIINIEQYIYSVLKDSHSLLLKKSHAPQTIFTYTPCSQREQLKIPNITKDLLSMFFQNTSIKQIPKGYGCCGAAGRYMLDHPNTAEKLAIQICDEFIEKNPELLNQDPANNNIIFCTGNIGCALHLRDVLYREYKINIVITHPIELIERFCN